MSFFSKKEADSDAGSYLGFFSSEDLPHLREQLVLAKKALVSQDMERASGQDSGRGTDVSTTDGDKSLQEMYRCMQYSQGDIKRALPGNQSKYVESMLAAMRFFVENYGVETWKDADTRDELLRVLPSAGQKTEKRPVSSAADQVSLRVSAAKVEESLDHLYAYHSNLDTRPSQYTQNLDGTAKFLKDMKLNVSDVAELVRFIV